METDVGVEVSRRNWTFHVINAVEIVQEDKFTSDGFRKAPLAPRMGSIVDGRMFKLQFEQSTTPDTRALSRCHPSRYEVSCNVGGVILNAQAAAKGPESKGETITQNFRARAEFWLELQHRLIHVRVEPEV